MKNGFTQRILHTIALGVGWAVSHDSLQTGRWQKICVVLNPKDSARTRWWTPHWFLFPHSIVWLDKPITRTKAHCLTSGVNLGELLTHSEPYLLIFKIKSLYRPKRWLFSKVLALQEWRPEFNPLNAHTNPRVGGVLAIPKLGKHLN